ncbi:MAG: methyltransferase domain-containing protein [Devosia sp.]|uniref:class I SAM-dependent methyltransferase n=1 Tax=Devosia sp. TaxID=1871048 RepID=UPI0024C91926|nr:class I SAM-dependent methyltransferase [Devosia sp.]UYN98289.1 MAG: methyltransferase domain-containing protein [Devosia sp.]
MAEMSAFWDRLADKYAARPIPDEGVYQTKLARTRAYFTPDMDLFEFGCGTGGTAIAHAPHVRHVTAIDFSENMLAFARDKAAKAGIGNVTFERGDITTMTVRPASYDMVLGLSILHLLKNKDAVIARVHHMLRPGGLFVSSTECIGDNRKWLRFIAPVGHALGLLPVLDIMTHAQLRNAITGAGFVIEHDWRPHPDSAAFIIARKPG